MRIVISEFMDAAAVAALAAKHETICDQGLVDRPDELRATVATADALIVRNRTQVDAGLLALAPKLKVVGRLGVGLDNIDVEACKTRGIEVIPATGANALAVAEYVIGAAMFLLRGAYASSAAVAGGQWPRPALSSGRELGGKTLGVVGFGGIGRLAAIWGALGMRVIGFDPQIPRRRRVGRGEAPAGSTRCWPRPTWSRCVPLVAATRHLIDARGGADEAGRDPDQHGARWRRRQPPSPRRSTNAWGAALDVFEQEPLRRDRILRLSEPAAHAAHRGRDGRIERACRADRGTGRRGTRAQPRRRLTPAAQRRAEPTSSDDRDHARSIGRTRVARAFPRRRESRDGGRDGAGAGPCRRAGPRVARRLARAAVRDASRERARGRRRRAAGAACRRRCRARRRPLRPRVSRLRACRRQAIRRAGNSASRSPE
jgi:(S)-sulfolactate dehydrogenase